MTTYSKLNSGELLQFYKRFTRAKNNYGVTFEDYKTLALEEHRLQRWAEEECNGTIQRDDETGRPFRHWPAQDVNSVIPIPDREKGCIRRCEEITARYGLRFYHQGDPRGCQVHVYRESDLNGSDIRSVYPTQAHAIFF